MVNTRKYRKSIAIALHIGICLSIDFDLVFNIEKRDKKQIEKYSKSTDGDDCCNLISFPTKKKKTPGKILIAFDRVGY